MHHIAIHGITIRFQENHVITHSMTECKTKYTVHHCGMLIWGPTPLKRLLFKSMSNTHFLGPKLREEEFRKFQVCLSGKKEILTFNVQVCL